MAASHKAMKTVGIAGAGLMGRGIAQIVAQAGFSGSPNKRRKSEALTMIVSPAFFRASRCPLSPVTR